MKARVNVAAALVTGGLALGAAQASATPRALFPSQREKGAGGRAPLSLRPSAF
jgi:hypothetical protein